MATGDETTEQPATLAELKAACPGASSDFLVLQQEENATVDQAKTAFIAWQGAQLRQAQSEAAKPHATGGLKGPVPARATRTASATRTATAESIVTGDPVEDFNDAIRAEMNKNGNDRRKAIKTVCLRDPDMHRAYLVAVNPTRAQRELLQDKFDFGDSLPRK